MALNILAKPTFMAGPEDALVAADAYGSGEIASVNSSKVDYSLNIPDSPVGIKIKPPPIPGTTITNPTQSGIGLKVEGLTKDETLKRLTDSDVSIKNCFTNMSDAAKGLLKVPTDLIKKVETTINGVVSKVKGLGDLDIKGKLKKLGQIDPAAILKRLGDLKSIGCSVNTLTKGQYDLTVTDKAGLSGLISGVTKQASFLGINNVFSSISKVIKDKDVLLSACKTIIPDASKDFKLLKDLASTDIGGNIKSLMPSISGNSIKNFKIEPGTNKFEYPIIFSNLKSTLDTVDNSWDKVIRSGETLIAGNLLTSPKANDFHKVLSSKVMTDHVTINTPIVGSNFELPNYDKPEMFLMLTKDLGDQNVKQSLKKDFPLLPIVIDRSVDNENTKVNSEIDTSISTVNYELTNNKNSVIEIIKLDANTQKISIINNNEPIINKVNNLESSFISSPSVSLPILVGSIYSTKETRIGDMLTRTVETYGEFVDETQTIDITITKINVITNVIISVTHAMRYL